MAVMRQNSDCIMADSFKADFEEILPLSKASITPELQQRSLPTFLRYEARDLSCRPERRREFAVKRRRSKTLDFVPGDNVDTG